MLRCRALALAADGARWVAATPEGLLVFALATAALFDPTDLDEAASRPSVFRLLGTGDHLRALLVAVRLNDAPLVLHALLAAPPERVGALASALPPAAALRVMAPLAAALATTPHLQFVLRWIRALCERHGAAIEAAPRSESMPVLRAVQQGLQATTARLAPSVEQCLYKLSYLTIAPAAGGDGALIIMTSDDV